MSESRSVGLLTIRRTSPRISSETAERRRKPHGPGMTWPGAGQQGVRNAASTSGGVPRSTHGQEA